MLSFMSSVYILDDSPLSDKNFPNFCLYVLLIVSFTIQKLFCLIYSHCLFLFPLLKKAYQKYNVNQYQRTYCPYFPKGVFMVSGLTFKPLVHILSLFFVHGFFVHIAGILHLCQQIWKTQQWPQGGKRSVFIPISKKGNAKGCSSSVQSLSHVRLFVTPWIAAHQASLFIINS